MTPLHKLQDETIKCDYCGKSKSLDKIQVSPTTAICVKCAENEAKFNKIYKTAMDEMK